VVLHGKWLDRAALDTLLAEARSKAVSGRLPTETN
jgi:hypothetical protein